MRKLVLVWAALVMVVALAACGGSSGDQGGGGDAGDQAGQEASTVRESPEDVQVAPDGGGTDGGDSAEAPEDTTLTVTVPNMERVQEVEIPTGPGTDESLFRDNVAVHLEGTGYPWEEEANVYIAGHRLGFRDEESWLAFYDLESLKNGDEIIVTDANGTEYVYEVFETITVAPTQVEVVEPIPGKNIVSLQSCTLPDYSDRVIVRGELRSQSPA